MNQVLDAEVLHRRINDLRFKYNKINQYSKISKIGGYILVFGFILIAFSAFLKVTNLLVIRSMMASMVIGLFLLIFGAIKQGNYLLNIKERLILHLCEGYWYLREFSSKSNEKDLKKSYNFLSKIEEIKKDYQNEYNFLGFKIEKSIEDFLLNLNSLLKKEVLPKLKLSVSIEEKDMGKILRLLNKLIKYVQKENFKNANDMINGEYPSLSRKEELSKIKTFFKKILTNKVCLIISYVVTILIISILFHFIFNILMGLEWTLYMVIITSIALVTGIFAIFKIQDSRK